MSNGKDKQCFHVGKLDNTEVQALKSLWQGEATPHQQRLAIATIVNKLSRSQEMLYIPGSFDETAFLEGRGFVGQQILKILNLPIAQLIGEST